MNSLGMFTLLRGIVVDRLVGDLYEGRVGSIG